MAIEIHTIIVIINTLHHYNATFFLRIKDIEVHMLYYYDILSFTSSIKSMHQTSKHHSSTFLISYISQVKLRSCRFV
jgi:hypothetical protein